MASRLDDVLEQHFSLRRAVYTPAVAPVKPWSPSCAQGFFTDLFQGFHLDDHLLYGAANCVHEKDQCCSRHRGCSSWKHTAGFTCNIDHFASWVPLFGAMHVTHEHPSICRCTFPPSQLEQTRMGRCRSLRTRAESMTDARWCASICPLRTTHLVQTRGTARRTAVAGLGHSAAQSISVDQCTQVCFPRGDHA